MSVEDILSRKNAEQHRITEALRQQQGYLSTLVAEGAVKHSVLAGRTSPRLATVRYPLQGFAEVPKEKTVSPYILLGNHAGTGQAVVLERKDIHNGVYVLGLNGTGKSSLLEYMLLQHARDGDGFALLDPHGDLTENVLGHVAAANRLQDVVYLDLTAEERVFGLNIFECDDITSFRQVDAVASAAMSLFIRLWGVSRSETPRLGMFLRNCAYTLIYNQATLAEMKLLLTDAEFRKSLVANVPNESVLGFWRWYDDELSNRERLEERRSTLNKIDELEKSPFVRAIVGQEKSTFNVRQIMDEGKILLVRLDPEYEDISNLVGIAVVNRIRQATLSRRKIPELLRRPFYLYADEFHRFVSRDFATQIDEGRKYRVGIIVAHQRGKQLGELEDVPAGVRNAIIFQVTDDDAERQAGRFDNTPPEPEEPVEEPGPEPRIIPTVLVTDPLEHLLHNTHAKKPLTNQLAREIKHLFRQEQAAKDARQREFDLHKREEQELISLARKTFRPSQVGGNGDFYQSQQVELPYKRVFNPQTGLNDIVTEYSVWEQNAKMQLKLSDRLRELGQQLGDSAEIYAGNLKDFANSYLLRWLYGVAPEDNGADVQQFVRYMYDQFLPLDELSMGADTYRERRLSEITQLFTRLRELGKMLQETPIYKADSQEFVIEYPQYPKTPHREPRRSYLDMRHERQNALSLQPDFIAHFQFKNDAGILSTVKPPPAPQLDARILAAIVAHYPTVQVVNEQIERRRSREGAILSSPAYGKDDIRPQTSNDDDEEDYLSERKQ